MNSVIQAITQEIIEQLLQTLKQTNTNPQITACLWQGGLGREHEKHKTTQEITYTDQNQRSARIICLTTNHIQLQKWHQSRNSGWSTQADIIIDQQTIHIYSRYTITNRYELTDPNSIQNTIQTITQKL